MKKEDSLDNLLREVGEVVPAAQVRQFVQQDRLEFCRRNFTERPGWKNNHGAEVSDGRGDTDGVRDAECDGPIDSHPFDQRRADFFPKEGRGWGTHVGKDSARIGVEPTEVDRNTRGTKTAQAIEAVGDMQEAERRTDYPGDK